MNFIGFFFLIFSESPTENIISRNSPIFCYCTYYCSICLTNSDARDRTEKLSDYLSITVLVVEPLLFAQSGDTELRHKVNQFEDHLTFNSVLFNAFSRRAKLHVQLIHLMMDDTENIEKGLIS